MPRDLMVVYVNLVPMIQAHCHALDATSNPVLFAFVDTSKPRDSGLMMSVPATIARALWAEGLPTLCALQEAALDPFLQLDTMPRLGLEDSFRPDVGLLAYQYWPMQELSDQWTSRKQGSGLRTGVPHMLRVEVRAHGCAPVSAEWKVLPRNGRAIPLPTQHLVEPVDVTPPKLPTAEEVASVERAAAEASRRHSEQVDANVFRKAAPTAWVSGGSGIGSAPRP